MFFRLSDCPYRKPPLAKRIADRITGIVPKIEEKKPPPGCVTPGCDGTGHVIPKFLTHHSVAGCPLAVPASGQRKRKTLPSESESSEEYPGLRLSPSSSSGSTGDSSSSRRSASGAPFSVHHPGGPLTRTDHLLLAKRDGAQSNQQSIDTRKYIKPFFPKKFFKFSIRSFPVRDSLCSMSFSFFEDVSFLRTVLFFTIIVNFVSNILLKAIFFSVWFSVILGIWSFSNMIDWLIDWSIDRLIGWLIGCLFDWLIDLLIDWLFDWLIGWLISHWVYLFLCM